MLAHDRFPSHAKTAVGLLRYGGHDVAAVIDRANAGKQVRDLLPGVQDAPIVEDVESAQEGDALAIGVAPIGGGFDESWRPDVLAALRRGMDVWSGLHYYLQEDPEFRDAAKEHDCRLWDVRQPPDDVGVSEGVASEVDAKVVLTVGTDCGVGKMTTSMELLQEAGRRGLDAGFVATGQTGVMIEGRGVVVDAVRGDFVAGAVEDMVLMEGKRDLVVVEGQGSLVHPAYSGVSLGILHGAMPDALVLCHSHGRSEIRGYGLSIPPVREVRDLYEAVAEPVCPVEVVAGSLDTSGLNDGAAGEAVRGFEGSLGAPAVDPVRMGAGELLDAVV